MFRRVVRWISPGEYLYLQIFGDASCSLCMASGTGLLNQNQCDWDEETLSALSALPITRDNLSPMVDLDAPSTGLRDPWKARWPELADIPWLPAIGDGAASNLGSGCDTDRRIAINLGTSGAIRVLWSADRVGAPGEGVNSAVGMIPASAERCTPDARASHAVARVRRVSSRWDH